jgi:hypothetical protein
MNKIMIFKAVSALLIVIAIIIGSVFAIKAITNTARKRCDIGTWNDGLSKCIPDCPSDQKYDKVTDACVCPPGFSGEPCVQGCEDGSLCGTICIPKGSSAKCIKGAVCPADRLEGIVAGTITATLASPATNQTTFIISSGISLLDGDKLTFTSAGSGALKEGDTLVADKTAFIYKAITNGQFSLSPIAGGDSISFTGTATDNYIFSYAENNAESCCPAGSVWGKGKCSDTCSSGATMCYVPGVAGFSCCTGVCDEYGICCDIINAPKGLCCDRPCKDSRYDDMCCPYDMECRGGDTCMAPCGTGWCSDANLCTTHTNLDGSTGSACVNRSCDQYWSSANTTYDPPVSESNGRTTCRGKDGTSVYYCALGGLAPDAASRKTFFQIANPSNYGQCSVADCAARSDNLSVKVDYNADTGTCTVEDSCEYINKEVDHPIGSPLLNSCASTDCPFQKEDLGACCQTTTGQIVFSDCVTAADADPDSACKDCKTCSGGRGTCTNDTFGIGPTKGTCTCTAPICDPTSWDSTPFYGDKCQYVSARCTDYKGAEANYPTGMCRPVVGLTEGDDDDDSITTWDISHTSAWDTNFPAQPASTVDGPEGPVGSTGPVGSNQWVTDSQEIEVETGVPHFPLTNEFRANLMCYTTPLSSTVFGPPGCNTLIDSAAGISAPWCAAPLATGTCSGKTCGKNCQGSQGIILPNAWNAANTTEPPATTFCQFNINQGVHEGHNTRHACPTCPCTCGVAKWSGGEPLIPWEYGCRP